MGDIFLCLITNRWTPKEFVQWLTINGYTVEHKNTNLYEVDGAFFIDIYNLENISDMELAGPRIYQGIMFEGSSLDPEEVEGLLTLNQIIALRDKAPEDEEVKKPSHLKVVKPEEEDV
jgi:hypothetical protein